MRYVIIIVFSTAILKCEMFLVDRGDGRHGEGRRAGMAQTENRRNSCKEAGKNRLSTRSAAIG